MPTVELDGFGRASRTDLSRPSQTSSSVSYAAISFELRLTLYYHSFTQHVLRLHPPPCLDRGGNLGVSTEPRAWPSTWLDTSPILLRPILLRGLVSSQAFHTLQDDPLMPLDLQISLRPRARPPLPRGSFLPSLGGLHRPQDEALGLHAGSRLQCRCSLGKAGYRHRARGDWGLAWLAIARLGVPWHEVLFLPL